MTSGADHEEILAEGRRVLTIGATAILAAADRIGADFSEACRVVAGASGRAICCGIGKSGHVARKIAGTLTSTGTPAIFLHPVEALHGDLGIVGPDDVAIFVSKSGDVSEVAPLLDHLARLDVPIVSFVGDVASALAGRSTAVLDCSVDEEACPMDLAPTTSTSVALALGDALAISVLQLKGFGADDFAALHPGGALGRKLTVRVSDVMVAEGYPSLPVKAHLRDAIAPLAEQRGTVPVVDDGGLVVGVLTAGDLTRVMEQRQDFLEVPVVDVMTADPKTAGPDELGSRAVARMERHGIMALPVLDEERRLVGVVHLHDLMKAGAV